LVTATPSYGANVIMTISLNSLANGGATFAGRQSTIANNKVDLADDSLVSMTFTSGATPTGTVSLYAFGSVDGTNFGGNAGITDAALTPAPVSGMKLLDTIASNSTVNFTYRIGPYSIAQAFGGSVPPMWGVFVNHTMGAASNSTAGNFQVQYVPIKYSSS
jgi:hypothetical protein